MKKNLIWSWEFVIVLVLLGVISFLSLGVVNPESSAISHLIISVLGIGFFFLAYQRSLSTFFLTFLTGVSTFMALRISFGDHYTGTAPLALPLILGPVSIFVISILVSSGIWYAYEKMKYREKFPLLLFLVFILLLIVLSFNTSYFHDWIIENLLTLPFLVLLYFTHRWFKFSHLSYGLIFSFLVLHVIGAHYTYAEVPFGDWLRNLLALNRNHYDRVVHFGFGLLLAYPMREIAKRIGNIKGFWAFYVPIEFVLAASAIFEILEWIITLIFAGDLGIAYLGTQGDPFDAIKDMALAGVGSIITMLIGAGGLRYYNPQGFWQEMKTSCKIKRRAVLGERAISELQLQKQRP
jgi:putative membrane protein